MIGGGYLADGSLFAGRYRIARELGRGGVSVVYAARDTQVGHDVALKLLVPSPATANQTRERMRREVNAVRQEMQAAGVWVFAGGLHPPSTATVVRVQGGEVVTTDGPFTEGKEHIGGFCIVRAADLDSALGWGKKMARATGLPIEVRPFQDGR